MTFDDFVSAVRSALSFADGAGIVIGLLVSGGVGAALGSIPIVAAMVLGAILYIAGYLASCYKFAKKRASGELANEADGALKVERDSALSRLADAESRIASLNREVSDLRRENAMLSSDENKAKLAEANARFDENRRKKQARSKMNRLSPKEAAIVLKVFKRGNACFQSEFDRIMVDNLKSDGVLEESGIYGLRLSRVWMGYLNEYMDVFTDLYGEAL